MLLVVCGELVGKWCPTLGSARVFHASHPLVLIIVSAREQAKQRLRL
jgi:hypothetical protein